MRPCSLDLVEEESGRSQIVASDNVMTLVSDRHEGVGPDEVLSPEEVDYFELEMGPLLREVRERRGGEHGLTQEEEAIVDKGSSLLSPSSAVSSPPSSVGEGVAPAQQTHGEREEGDTRGAGEKVRAGRSAEVAAMHQVELQVGHFAWESEGGQSELITVDFSVAVFGADGRGCSDYRIDFLVASMHVEASIKYCWRLMR